LPKALFLDRDGVINVDVGHAHRIHQIQFVSGIFELAKRAHELAYTIIIVTNQAGIAKGLYSEAQFYELMIWMRAEFAKNGSFISHVAFCPHHENGTVTEYTRRCVCRKPMPGMFLESIQQFDIDPSRSLLVGDNESDLIAGHRAAISDLYLYRQDLESSPLVIPEVPVYERLSKLEPLIERLV
jgi:D-glycero-D-manno-heptose 1,7-bisphosphate phosphatase